jgi:SAM-dependent methyltransferase
MGGPRGAAIPERIRWAVAQLELAPGERVLEIGSGPGHAVALVAERLRRGKVTGIDRSPLQVDRARARNAAAIAAGRACIERLALDEAPQALGERTFHEVFAVNLNVFWTRPAPSINSAQRLLRRGGRLYVLYEPPSAARRASLEASLPDLFEAQRARVVEVRTVAFAKSHGVCFVVAWD